MSDLYAINLHLQERLEREWREEVCAAEAAVRLDDANLLRDYKRGLPLRTLLRAGRIAGQQQRPDQSNGSWWIRRLAESRDAVEIQQARRQIRRYLPIDRDILHAEWPLSRGNSTFWEELGRTVAAFGYLENELTSACYTLTAPPADFSDLQPDQVEAHLMWYAKVEGYRADAMFALTERFDELLREDGRVPHTVRTDLRGRLDEFRTWRNALCHGAWFGFSGAGAGGFRSVPVPQSQPLIAVPQPRPVLPACTSTPPAHRRSVRAPRNPAPPITDPLVTAPTSAPRPRCAAPLAPGPRLPDTLPSLSAPPNHLTSTAKRLRSHRQRT